MRFTLFVIVSVSCLICSFSAPADSFKNEIGFGYSRSHHSPYTVKGYTLTGTQFLSPVNIDAGPLGEAVFLARIPRAGINLAYVATANDFYPEHSTDSQYGVNAAYASKHTPITAGIGINRIIYSHDSGPTTSPAIIWNQIHGGIGAYVTDRSHIGIDYTRVYADSPNAISSHIWELSGKHLATISETQSFSISANIQRSVADSTSASSTRMLTTAVEYYLTPATSVGARFQRWTIDSWDVARIHRTVNVTTFITPTYIAGISLQNVNRSSARKIFFDVGTRF